MPKRDYNCSDFSSQAQAQQFLLPGDPYGLDRAKDGKACDILP
jgi:Excalibur calcium-binding domain